MKAKKLYAVALCRVSSLEQLKNNSLATQKDNVLKAAEELGAIIPSDGIWEGQVSSKVGVNFNRKDLVEIFEYCKKHPLVKYLIVQEVDRFMRSPEEQTYWYVKFWYELKVKVWFADKPELNEDSHNASLFRFLEGWRAGGSNVERINKSINGQTKALQEGRYPFAPKPGYMRGTEIGIPAVHPVRGPALKKALIEIVTKQVSPTQGLINLNNSEFTKDGHSKYKMDKFRKIVTDPFYAGVVEINKQVKVRNEKGLHEPLITLEQHYELVRIMDIKKKFQKGPRKNGNPKYPLNNIVSCDLCTDKTNGRYVGFDHGNGKNPKLIYEKYRCRGCNRYLKRHELHGQVEEIFKKYEISAEGMEILFKALIAVWNQKAAQAKHDAVRIRKNIERLKATVSTQAIAAIEPSNISIKDEILSSIEKSKDEITKLEQQLEELESETESDKEAFLKFAFDFVNDTGSQFLKISSDKRLKCKQVIFPSGFCVDLNNRVYTPEISPLYTLAANKKDAEASEKAQLVRVRGL